VRFGAANNQPALTRSALVWLHSSQNISGTPVRMAVLLANIFLRGLKMIRDYGAPYKALAAVVLAALLGGLAAGGPSDKSGKDGEWPAYGRDAGGTRHSPLSQITRDNVKDLKVAWTYHTGETGWTSAEARKSAFEATPIMVDGTLYLSTPFDVVIALDPETGKERWTYNPSVDESLEHSEVTSRGVSTWTDSRLRPGASAYRRIFVATIDARLIALDAAAGKPCRDFGKDGEVDLSKDVRIVNRSDYEVTSPPAIIGDLVVVGSSIGDNRGVELERGVVRAYDARSGKLVWSWDPIPTSDADPARKTWQGDSNARTGAANAWGVISADPERGLVFVPTSSPSPDFYGGERKGSNLYTNSVVALRSATGKVAWYFQVVHHDLWDYDVPAQPVLSTVKRGGKSVAAVLVATKMGNLFVLERETGKPLFPVEERPVPKSDVAGEESSPTQPFPVLPPPLVPQNLTPESAWGITPADQDVCRKMIESMRHGGIFLPPSLEGSIMYPGNVGGVNWGGLSYDPVHNIAIAQTNRLAFEVKLIPRDEYNKMRSTGASNRLRGEFGRMTGTPYAMYREPLFGPSGAPCTPPPWGALTAVDMNTGQIKWEVPLGSIPQLGKGAAGWGSINLGGSIVTAGGLVFIGAAMDTFLRAFDIETGREVWKAELPASDQASPMTYQGKDGKQYVVIAAGGHGKLRTKRGDSVVAFRLP
jgi:quinoprotein glucose dehydrogenase